ncbi:ABC transporter permease, partial [Muricomes intestini]|uniref:ABC transporter permease n=1 Tax=Muricomes intestini TaxID=1796634 RepID=UPI002FE2562E
MGKYLFKRILICIATIFVMITITFFLIRLMPGGPFSDPKISEEVKERLNSYYGYDQPMIVQYGKYMANFFRGDLGYSMKYVNRSVVNIIAHGFPYSLDIGLRALVFGLSFGLVLGILSALNRGNKIDIMCVIISIIGTSVPDFIVGTILQYFFGYKWGLLPVAQYKGLSYTVMPMIAMGLATMAGISRTMRATMLEVVNQDYIKTAKSKGLTGVRITVKHQIRNAIMPIVTGLGPQVAGLFTGTFVIEALFAIPGIGKYYVDAVKNSDYSLVMGLTLFYGVFLVFSNMVVDILYGV